MPTRSLRFALATLVSPLFLTAWVPWARAVEVEEPILTTPAGISPAEYAPKVEGPLFQATNRAQALQATFGERGLVVVNSQGGAAVTLSLRAWGREGALTAVGPRSPVAGPCVDGGAVDGVGACVHRVDYPRPGLTEWWENRPEGLELGFTVSARPEGEGPLIFEVAVGGAVARVEDDAARLSRETGDPLRISGLAAWDEGGRVLPTWMEESGAGLRLVVDDSDAVGVVTVDPLLTTVSWTATMEQRGTFGYSVASAGDVNGDGYADVIVGAQMAGTGASEGAAFLFSGSASGLGSDPAWVVESDVEQSYFGNVVASAGDVNGDGYSDVVVGAYEWGSAEQGAAFLYLGGASGLSTTAAWTAASDQEMAYFGSSAASAGDVNGDGFDDVVVGACGYNTSRGAAFLFLGSGSGLATTPSWMAEGQAEYPDFGCAVASAGDLNGDGYDDVVVGAKRYGGAAYVYLGSASGLATSASWTLQPGAEYADFGHAVASAGDVNGDGFGDLVVGAARYGKGAVFLYLGGASGLSTSAAWIAASDQAKSSFGASVASAGDVDGDGFDDVVVGAPDYDIELGDEGAAFLYRGSASGLETAASWTSASDEQGASFGVSVASAGDVNGDGLSDVVVGASGANQERGRAFLYLGFLPGEEVCNGLDDDGDGDVDEDAADAGTWYADADVDGYTDPEVSTVACDAPVHFAAATEDDCDDADPQTYPGAMELPGDGVDQDCDGADPGGCACSTGSGAASAWSLFLGVTALVALRRRGHRPG